MLKRFMLLVVTALLLIGAPATTSAAAGQSGQVTTKAECLASGGKFRMVAGEVRCDFTVLNKRLGQAESKSKSVPSKRLCARKVGAALERIPCFTNKGSWFDSGQCYQKSTGQTIDMTPEDADVPASEVGQDRRATEWSCWDPGTGKSSYLYRLITSFVVPPDPADVLVQAKESMSLRGVHVNFPFKPSAKRTAFVGFPLWFWGTGGESAVGPITRTANAGSVQVRATAELESVVWSMGDGKEVTCRNPATGRPPAAAERGRTSSTGCIHLYERSSGSQPGKTFSVIATSHWVLHWTSTVGAATQRHPDMRFTVAADPVQLPVHEIQVLVS